MDEFIGQPFFSCRNCRNCRNPLAARDDILSKRFWAKTGPAYLFRNVTNVALGRTEDRKLITGVYSVADIHCSNCGETLGWKYLRVYEELHKYKEGKFILEKSKILKEY